MLRSVVAHPLVAYRQQRALKRAVGVVLEELDRPPFQIAQLLEQEAIVALKGSSSICAIAKFFHLRLAGFEGVKVLVYSTTIKVKYNWPRWQSLSFKRNYSLFHFILRFDTGNYPALAVDTDLPSEPVTEAEATPEAEPALVG